ncbi:MAG: tetratricopeptide repeat protein [Rhodospirillales bacterium]|nr:tetratricopeptide repeat protein [Rhodospirillales bacterium]
MGGPRLRPGQCPQQPGHSAAGVGGRGTEAEAAYRRAVALGEALWAANPEWVNLGDGLARVHNNLGTLLSGSGRGAEAEAAYRRAVALMGTPVGGEPGAGGDRRRPGPCPQQPGPAAERRRARTEEAEAAYRRAVALWEPLWAAHRAVDLGDMPALATTTWALC